MTLVSRAAAMAGVALASALVLAGSSLAVTTTPGSDLSPGTTPRGPTGIVVTGTVDPAAVALAAPATPALLTSSRSRGRAPIRLRITVGGVRLQGTLGRSPAARDLLRQLPLRLRMSEHGGVEKTGRLPRSLSLRGQPSSADPVVGDIGYYAPGRDLVLYHGDQSRYPGIVVLGRLAPGAAAQVAVQPGTVTVRVRALR